MKRCLIILTVLLLISFQGVALASDIKPMIPIAEQLSAAKINDMEYDEENGFVCIEYSPADSADLDYLFTLCAACGTFSIASPDSSDGQTQIYLLLVPGTDFAGYVTFAPQEAYVRLFFPDSAGILEGDGLEALLAELYRIPRLPSGKGSNVLPQFYACVNRQPSRTGLQSDLSYAFDNQTCWTEIYDEIDSDKLSCYTIKMLQFGCMVNCDVFLTDDEERFDPCVLHFSNGDAEIIVNFSAPRQSATVHYKPGVSYNLLEARELAEAFE